MEVCFQTGAKERNGGWGGTAAESSELATIHTRQWQQLNEVRQLFDEQVAAAERETAGFLVKTPYILLLSVTGINVVSAGRRPSQGRTTRTHPPPPSPTHRH